MVCIAGQNLFTQLTVCSVIPKIIKDIYDSLQNVFFSKLTTVRSES